MRRQFAFILFFVLVYTSSAFAQQPRPEYPRPQFERKEWINLNGEWSCQFDFVGEGVEKRLYDSKGFEGKMNVPWGYGEPPHSLEEFYSRLESMVDGLMGISENVWGYCYTQLTDVEQEQNGIYFYDRSCKFDMKRIHSIFSKKPHISE